ncbi:histone deacetylase HDT1 isoform X2 [Daucus carota subsp. sativus]|uniref:histone deacetylase HDT1 isoform X2 n=1 Tax=Daucus carota subsp. sativus TaxID=79200 RepID=UPI0007EFF858|nr:PREDICTED: histone deacetylase HDT1-like isoform X2 [Daucus carota subsp. sativus]
MEFWAAEVKAGESFKVKIDENKALHLSQACIGDVEKDIPVSICLYVKVDEKKLALGTLNSKKLFQQSFDLVFDKTFEISHNWKNGSIFFLGYTADNEKSDRASDVDDSDAESDEDIPVIAANDKQKDKEKAKIVEPRKAASSDTTDDSSEDDETSSEDDPKVSVKKDSAAGKQKANIVEPTKDVSSDDTDDSSDDDETSSEDDTKVSAEKVSAAGKQKAKIVDPKNDADSGDDDAMSEDYSEEADESDEDSDSDEDEETPVQVKSSKKRALTPAKKALPEKKAKLITPPKTDGKKSSVHVATPYPSKQTGKTPANKLNQQTPKTDGSHTCNSCKRTFKSEVALESHNKAKHTGGK